MRRFSNYFVLLLFLICGCQPTEHKPKNRPQILRTCIAADILSSDPRKGVSMHNQGVVRMLFAGLVRLEQDLTPRLELAESYRISPDYKTYVFTLKDCKWSDGSPITASDFENSWKAALTPAYSSAGTNMFFHIKNGRKAFLGQISIDQFGVKALDDKTLVIELENPNPHFLNILFHSVFSPVHKSMLYTPPNNAQLICSGPFCLKKHLFENQIVLEKNPSYWNSANVKLDELHYYIIKDRQTALAMFEKEELDWLGEPLTKIALESIPSLKAKGRLNSFPFAGQQWMFINTEKKPLSNVNIRKALSYAMNRKMIMKELLHLDEAQPTLGLIPKIVKKEKWHPWFVDNDVQEAKALFEKGLGELGLLGKPFPKIKISYHIATDPKPIQAIQQMWKENLGIDVEVDAMDPSSLFNNWYSRNYDITWLGWIVPYNDPTCMMELFKYKNSQPNNSGWENSDFIRHAEASLSSGSESERLAHNEAAEKIFCDEMPSIPVYDTVAFYLQQPYVKDVVVNELYLVDFERAYLEPETKQELHAH